MKNTIKLFGLIALAATIGFAACGDGGQGFRGGISALFGKWAPYGSDPGSFGSDP